jgi:hypothetical protein
VFGYTIKIPVCTSNLTADCINYTHVSAITNAPRAIMYLGEDGNLYLTNDTQIQYTIVNNYTTTNYTTVYNVTNVSQFYNVTNYYSYNLTNGSNMTIIQNITANDSVIKEYLEKFNLSLFNGTIYNKTEADSVFAFKGDLSNIQNSMATKAELGMIDNKYSPLLALSFAGPNGSLINLTSLSQKVDENTDSGFSITWKVIIVINCILLLLIIVMIAKMMMSG